MKILEYAKNSIISNLAHDFSENREIQATYRPNRNMPF